MQNRLSIREFCQKAGISRSLYYILQAQGRGPLETRVNSRVLIAEDTAEAWIREREGQPKQAVAA